MKDDQLEILSDKVRRGESIGFLEAIAVINYQEQLKIMRKNESFFTKLKRFFGVVE